MTQALNWAAAGGGVAAKNNAQPIRKNSQMGRFLRDTDRQVFSRTSRDRNHRQLGSNEARLCVRYCSDQSFHPEY